VVTVSSSPPLVSVVVPLYNKAEHVARALGSVLTQTFQDFEILVVDDGSTDGGATVVEGFVDPRIRLIRQANAGVSVARNNGVDAARASLIAFLDADDAYRPDFLENALTLRARYPAAGGFAMNYEVIDQAGLGRPGVPHTAEPTLLLDPATYFRIGKFGSPVFSSSVVVDKAVLERAGGFPAGVRLGEDIDTWLRICFIAPIAFDRRLGGIYFLDAGNRAVTTNPPPERYVFFDTIDRWVAGQPPLSREVLADINEFKNFFSLIYARFQIRWGVPSEGRRALINCHTRDFALGKWKWLLASLLPQRWQHAIGHIKQGIRS